MSVEVPVPEVVTPEEQVAEVVAPTVADVVSVVEDVEVTQHLNLDPNDPRNTVPAGALPSLDDVLTA